MRKLNLAIDKLFPLCYNDKNYKKGKNTMRKDKKKLLPVFLVLITVFLSLFSGCSFNGYKGKYRAAYTAAINCIPNTRGYWCGEGPFFKDPVIYPLEKDEYGRTMYVYFESHWSSDFRETFHVLIVQKEDGDTAYYYPEDNFLSKAMPYADLSHSDYTSSKTKERLYSVYTDEELTALKTLNNWNEPIQTEKCDHSSFRTISEHVFKQNGRGGNISFSSNQWNEVIRQTAIENGHVLSYQDEYGNIDNIDVYSKIYWMSTDEYGRELYYIDAYYYHYSHYEIPPRYSEDEGYSSIEYYLYMIAILQPDGSHSLQEFIVELDNLCTPQAQMKALKASNGWNTPLSQSENE